MVKILLEHGANPHARTKRGNKPSEVLGEGLRPDVKKGIMTLLKDAEKAWKRAGKKI